MINLVVKDLHKRFGGLHALRGVSFEVNGPELIGLIERSAAKVRGKDRRVVLGVADLSPKGPS